MNINEILNSGHNVSITITPADLKEFALAVAAEVLAAQAGQSAQKEEVYMTTDEVAARLNVSTNTLWRWHRTGYLTHTKVGARPMYKESEVINLLNGRK